jgi:hypothetical protein
MSVPTVKVSNFIHSYLLIFCDIWATICVYPVPQCSYNTAYHTNSFLCSYCYWRHYLIFVYHIYVFTQYASTSYKDQKLMHMPFCSNSPCFFLILSHCTFYSNANIPYPSFCLFYTEYPSHKKLTVQIYCSSHLKKFLLSNPLRWPETCIQ